LRIAAFNFIRKAVEKDFFWTERQSWEILKSFDHQFHFSRVVVVTQNHFIDNDLCERMRSLVFNLCRDLKYFREVRFTKCRQIGHKLRKFGTVKI